MKSLIIIVSSVMLLFLGCNKSSDYGVNNNNNNITGPNVISVGGTSFSPNSLNVNVGDTVKFVWSNGSHTTTAVSVPQGAATWNSPLNSSSTSFFYVVTVAGTYNFHCNIHYSMGMVGSFTAH